MNRTYLDKKEIIGFTKCRTDSDYQRCSYCGEKIGKGNVVLSIIKKCSNRLNCYIHINCIEDFSKAIIKFKKDNINYLIIEQIQKI